MENKTKIETSDLKLILCPTCKSVINSNEYERADFSWFETFNCEFCFNCKFHRCNDDICPLNAIEEGKEYSKSKILSEEKFYLELQLFKPHLLREEDRKLRLLDWFRFKEIITNHAHELESDDKVFTIDHYQKELLNYEAKQKAAELSKEKSKLQSKLFFRYTSKLPGCKLKPILRNERISIIDWFRFKEIITNHAHELESNDDIQPMEYYEAKLLDYKAKHKVYLITKEKSELETKILYQYFDPIQNERVRLLQWFRFKEIITNHVKDLEIYEHILPISHYHEKLVQGNTNYRRMMKLIK